MTDSHKETGNKTEHVCAQCGTSSAERPLLLGEYQGHEIWICVRCLPVLIHGAH